MSEELSKEINWTHSLEAYFKATGEKCHGLSLLHKRSEEKYSKSRTFIDLPVIVGSSIVGFMSVGSNQIFQGSEYAPVALGVASLVVSVLQTVNTYFGWSKRTEGHRISAIQYSKLYRFLAVELSLPREQRMSPHDLLKLTKDQYDRLQEISPLIPKDILTQYKHEFKKITDVTHPEETNGIEKITIYNPMNRDGTTYSANTLGRQTEGPATPTIGLQITS